MNQSLATILQKIFRKTSQNATGDIGHVLNKSISNSCNNIISRSTFMDVVLNENQEMSFKKQASETAFILPIFGELEFKSMGTVENIPVQYLKILPSGIEQLISIGNNFSDSKINFLFICLPLEYSDTQYGMLIEPGIYNQIIEVLNKAQFKLGVGIFDERTSSEIALNSSSGTTLIYVLNGVFEVEDRLLENRDGLILTNKNSIEFEALLPNSVLLAIELK